MNFDTFWDSIGQRIYIDWLRTTPSHNMSNNSIESRDLDIKLRDVYYYENETCSWHFAKYLNICYNKYDFNDWYGLNPADADMFPYVIVSSNGNTWAFTGMDETFSINGIKFIGRLDGFNTTYLTEEFVKTQLELIAGDFGFDDADDYLKSTIRSTFECIFYTMKCSKDLVDKESHLDLYYIGAGQLTEECDILNPSLLVNVNDDFPFAPLFNPNYVYIDKLKRYYYITRITNVHNNIWRLDLHVDVLYSYNTDIHKQYGYIVRNELNPYGVILPDERVSFFAEPLYTFTDVTGGTKANKTLDVNVTSGVNIVLSVINEQARVVYTNILPPSSTSLPEIDGADYQNALAYNYATDGANFRQAMLEVSQNQTLASFIIGAWIYPFNFAVGNIKEVMVPVVLSPMTLGTTTLTAKGTLMNCDLSGYLIVADFTLPSYDSFDDIEPYTYCDLYIPYYSGIYHFDLQRCAGHNIMVYYTTQFSNGNSNVYIYDYTDNQLLLCAPVQLAQQLAVSTTNAFEINQQRALSHIGYAGDTMDWLFKAISSGASDNILGVFTSTQKWMGETIQWGFNQSLMKDTASVGVSSANGGAFNPQKVYLITKKRQKNIADLQTFETRNGYPINTWDYLSTTGYEYTGYTEITQLHYTPSTQTWITSPEIDEIEILAKNGIIL